jgi:hypothetical protein
LNNNDRRIGRIGQEGLRGFFNLVVNLSDLV